MSDDIGGERRHSGVLRAFVFAPLILAGLVAVLLLEASWFRRSKSITFDETYYLSCGLQTVHDRRLDPRIAAEGVGPLPLLLTYVPSLWWQPRESRPEPWKGQLNDRQLIVGPRRANTLLIGVPLAVLVFVWLYRRRGLPAATVGTGILVLSPTIVAHCSLATMDAGFALFAVLAVAATAWYLRRPGWGRFCLWAVAIAAAMTAKYSGVLLLPAAGLLLFFRLLPERWSLRGCGTAGAKSVAAYLVLLSLIVPIWWGFHGFTCTGPLKNYALKDTPDSSPYVKLLGRGPMATWFMELAHRKLKRPAPLAGVVFQYLHNQTGHGSFLMGRISQTGWWYYFPCAFAFKSTPVELLLTGVTVVSVLISLRSSWSAFRKADPALQSVLVVSAVFIAMLLTARINIGHRYLIVLYPMLVFAACDRLAVWLQARPYWFGLLGGLLLGGQCISNLATAPHFLEYFNRCCGGPELGWRLLVDSNIDWGQDLPALERQLSGLRDRPVALQYFGTARPEAYGIEADRVEKLAQPPDAYRALAISASCLQGLYVVGGDAYRSFRALTPDRRAGYSIFVFRLDSPERRAAFRSAAAQVQQGLARRRAAPPAKP